jgi:hypothetical protein
MRRELPHPSFGTFAASVTLGMVSAAVTSLAVLYSLIPSELATACSELVLFSLLFLAVDTEQ